MKTVAFHTLGCKLNFSETSTIARQFLDQGFSKTEFSEPSDVYVVNTCSVTEQANQKCRQIIRKALTLNPEAYVIVVGCYAQLKPQEIADIPGVDLVLGAGDKFRIHELVQDFTKEDNPCVLNSEIKDVEGFVDAFSIGDRTRSFLKVQDGCDYKCTFCTIPLARGKSRSDTMANVLANATKLADSGVKEIVLTGVNIGDYGTGLSEKLNFLDLVKALDQVETVERFRISSIEPNLLSNEIIEYVAGSQRFMPHFHVPLQSGNDELLGLMRRRYRRDLYADRVAKIKELMPHACIGVDVIVGFPGETEAHFLDTYQFLNELDVSYFHVFTYSERENTLAIDMEGRVPKKERHRRNEMLRILSEKKRRAFYAQFEGDSRPVLWEEAEVNGVMHGFTDNYIKVEQPYEAAMANSITTTLMADLTPAGAMRASTEQLRKQISE
ncbi:MAG: tRNA (N(6)-L-threonylcarbamoyladenosine(37)-C(2))-methylthiotransferase MtaB [Bacteroidia bacterium]|nr:tRNA (N(6)-L-threonylcarbamoyladenosine(37)-C(2))-methylthiotransferase MtaB [Bacteroidia bacterium]